LKPVLTVKLESDSLERVRADVLVVGVAPTDRPLQGVAGYADWRLCGRLWKLVSGGRISGERGQASLVIPGAGFRTRLLLVLGLGPRSSLEVSDWQQLGRDAIDRSLGLRANTVTLAILEDAFVDPAATGESARDTEKTDALGGLISGAAHAVAARGEGLELAVIASSVSSSVSLSIPKDAAIPAGVEIRVAGSALSQRQMGAKTGNLSIGSRRV
jgi:hypothetical protein